MEHENLFEKLKKIMKEIERIERERPTAPAPDEPADPQVVSLIREGQLIVRELDPIVRGVFGARRDTLAWWEDVVRRCNLPDLEQVETESRVAELIDDGMRMTKELDPMVREAFRDDPVALAEWDSIMRMDPDYDKEDPDKSRS